MVKGSEMVDGTIISCGGQEVQLELGEVILKVERMET